MNRKTIDQISSDELDALYAERDRLRAAILDIDAHATPMGLADATDPDGNPHHYAVTVGALHRALGKVGHTAPLCTAEAAIARVLDLDVPDAAAANHPAYALGWKDALALVRGVIEPAQRPGAGTGSGVTAAAS